MTTTRAPIAPDLPWARYLRLSKAEAAEDRDKTQAERIALTVIKLNEHLVELTLWLDRQGIPYSDDLIFMDAALSAWKPGVVRPAWDTMMTLAREGRLAGIGIVAVDRFTRDVTTMEDLIKLADANGIKIGGPRAGSIDLNTYEGIIRARGAAQQAANESLATSYRIKETLHRKMEAGKPMGGGRMFGFERGGQVQIPEEVKILRTAAEDLTIRGKSWGAVAADLNRRGYTTTRGLAWTGQNLRNVLGQMRYGGHVELKGDVVGTIPGKPVFDAETYANVQALIASRRRGRRASGRFPLTGIMTCARCGGASKTVTLIGYQGVPRVDGSRPRLYRCSPVKGGCGMQVDAIGTERTVSAHMIKLLADPANVRAIVDQDVSLNAERAAVHAQLEDTEAMMTDLETKWQRKECTRAAYEANMPWHLANRKKYLAQLATLTPAVAVGTYDASTEWDLLNDTEKVALIKRFGVKITVRPGQHARRYDESRIRFL